MTAVPVFAWWRWAVLERRERDEQVRTKVRVPNVQTVDDLMIERCRPGDVLLFDRKWEHCAAGPWSAFMCLLGRAFLCFDDPNKAIADGKFDHCGELGLRKIFSCIIKFSSCCALLDLH